MAKNSVNTAPIIPVGPPPIKPEKIFPVGKKVYAILRGGEQDGQVVEAEIQGHSEENVLITYIREDGILAIEPIPISDVATSRAKLEAIIHPARAEITETVKKRPILKVAQPAEEVEGLRELVTEPKILDGAGAESLKESIELFELATGDTVVAATDQGKKYKDHNEDRVVVISHKNAFAVIDAMGGHASGLEAAQIHAEKILELPDNPNRAAQNALDKYKKENLGNAGTCFIYGLITTNEEGQKFLNVFQAGDVKLIIYDKNGNIKFQTKDQSLVEEMIDKGIISPDEAYYSPYRSSVSNAITTSRRVDIHRYMPIQIESGDRIVACSDGITDNLDPEEIWELIEGKSPEQAIEDISDVTDERMKNHANIIIETNKRGGRHKTKIYSDGYKSEPKPDNRSIVIVDIT